MKFKLDECLDARLAGRLRSSGHDSLTVADQGLRGVPDPELHDHCRGEGRILITFDLDFSNVVRYPPADTPGLVVFRGPDTLLATGRVLLDTLIAALADEDPTGKLWIVEPGRIRVYEPPD